MNDFYFIDKQHELNFKKTLLRWSSAKSNSEYSATCYILSIPMIYEKFEQYISEFENPISWIFSWEWHHTLSNLDEYKDFDDGDEVPKYPIDLTNAMVQLGKFALNMWNGYEHFNLLDCISSLDDKNYKALMSAIDIRMRKLEY